METTLFSPTWSAGSEGDLPYRALIDLCSAAREVHDPHVFLNRLCGTIAETFGINDVMVHGLDEQGRLALLGRAGELVPAPPWPAPGVDACGDLIHCPGAADAIAALVEGRTPYLWLAGEQVAATAAAGHGGLPNAEGEPEAVGGIGTLPPGPSAVGDGRHVWARAGLALALDGTVVGTLGLAVRGEESEFAAEFAPALAPFAQLAAAAVQRAREAEVNERRAQRLAALERVSAAGVTQANLDDFLRDACDTLLGVTGMDLAAATLFDPASETLQARVVRGRAPDVLAFYERFSLGERLMGQAARERCLRVHRALQQDESPEARIAREAGLETALCMPLWLRDQMLGVLFLATATPREPESEEIDLVAAVAHQLSAAIANSILLEQARRQMEEHRKASEELQVLHDISRAMVATNSLEERLREIARGLTRVTGTTHCAIFRREPDALAPWVCYGATEEQSRRFHSLDMPTEEVKRLVRLLRSRKGPLVMSGGMRDPFGKSEWLREQQIGAGLWLPFHLERRIIGVALCYRPGEAPSFSPEQLGLADAIATQGAIAIRMSQAFEHERNIAEALQQGLLPTAVQRLGHFELGNAYHPALQEARVGGDFYDVFPLPDGRVALLMADVSGKGLAAAKQTTMIKNMLRLIAFEDPEPATALGRLNRAVYYFTDPELFVTAFYGVLSPDAGELVYANAGHDCPLHYRAEERFCTALDTTGMALGMDAESCYSRRRLPLGRGDVLLLYTDGVTDAREGGRFFGRERLEAMLVRYATARPSQIVKYLYKEARTFSDSGLHDDVALLCLKAKE